jgi:hypothetical protein
MAILASAQWWVRQSGNELNGGGFDSAISGAGTNYADADAAILSLTDFATSGAGSVNLTSATGGFTSAMVGNAVRIASGTNFQTGYYFITSYTSSTQVALDRTPTSGGAGSGGTGRVGGAWASLVSATRGGVGLPTPLLATPVAPGHIVNIRGSGDYTYTGGYWEFALGDTTNGPVQFLGYNGRPRIDVGGRFANQGFYEHWSHLKFVLQGASGPSIGIISQSGYSQVDDCYFDQNGYDCVGVNVLHVIGCRFVNSGSASAGTQEYAAISGPNQYGGLCVDNYIDGWRGCGIYQNGAAVLTVSRSIIVNCKHQGITFTTSSLASFGRNVQDNVIYGCTSDGVRFVTTTDVQIAGSVRNNVIVANGGYGINLQAGTLILNDKFLAGRFDRNAFYLNTSGTKNLFSVGPNDVTLSADPFIDAVGGDFGLNNVASGGALLKGIQRTFPGNNTTSYQSIGAAEPEQPTDDAIAAAVWSHAERTLT